MKSYMERGEGVEQALCQSTLAAPVWGVQGGARHSHRPNTHRLLGGQPPRQPFLDTQR